MRAPWKSVVVMALAAVAAGPTQAYTGNIKVVLTNSQDAPVAGAAVALGVGGWPVQGYTGVDGTLTFAYSGGDLMKVLVTAPNHGASVTTPSQNLAVDNVFELQTQDLVVRLLDHNGGPLAGGKVSISDGGWPQIGITDASGVVHHEMFDPGFGTVRMTIHNFTQAVPTEFPETVFQTGLVNLVGGPFRLGTSGWPLFANPSEMLPVPTRFSTSSSSAGEFWLTPVAGGVTTGGRLRLLDADGHGLAGGKATPAVGGSWKPTLPDATDADGYLTINVDYVPTKIKMVVNQSSKEQAGNYVWQTSLVPVFVDDDEGAGIPYVSIDQGGGFWDVGKLTTDANGYAELAVFAGFKPKLRANVDFTSLTLTAPNGLGPAYVFQTGKVVSDSGNCTVWGGGSWRKFAQGQQMFANTYNFRFSDQAQTAYSIAAGTVNHIH